MSYEEIYELIKYNDKETNLFMPNEIFDDLKDSGIKAVHIPFTYAYYYFTTWMYRYVKNVVHGTSIDNTIIKEVLGYKSSNRTVNYIISKNGYLDQMGYTATTRDYPVGWTFTNNDEEDLEFQMLGDIIDDVSEYGDYLPQITRKFFLKYPIKAFERDVLMKNDEGVLELYETRGTFHDIECTHNIQFETFLHCVSKPVIGVIGFYIYSYLKHKNDMFTSGFDISLEKLSRKIGIPVRTIVTYISALKSYNLISFRHNQDYYIEGLAWSERRANTYITNDYFMFKETKQPYARLGYMDSETYAKMKDSSEKMDDVDSEMPFGM